MDTVLSANFTQFGLDADAVLMGESSDLSGSLTVLRIWKLRTVVHDRGKTELDSLTAQIGGFSVVKVDRNGNGGCLGKLDKRAPQGTQAATVVLHSILGQLEDQG